MNLNIQPPINSRFWRFLTCWVVFIQLLNIVDEEQFIQAILHSV